MIFPFLRGFRAPHFAPITWFLFAVNVLVFIGTLETFERADSQIDEILTDKSFTETQGASFAAMIRREPALFTPTIRKLARTAGQGDKDSRNVLGSLALRNPSFMERAEDYAFGGDEIAVGSWRKQFHELRLLQESHPSYRWGISTFHHQWQQWVSYQFAHSGFLHLFWNMIFLLIFGTFIELELGASFVIFTYLGGGLFGAAAYSVLSGVSSSPLVGASAAVSALMALVTVHWWRKEKLSYVYWLLPVRGYYGLTRLPSWTIGIVSLLPDLSGYLAASRDFGSVAYSAHIGGALWGVIICSFLSLGLLVSEAGDVTPESPLV